MQNQDFIAGLKAKFAEHRIVFWHDPDKRFIEELEQLELENVTIINMTHASQLAVKKRIEIDEPEQQFCCGSPMMRRLMNKTGCWISAFTAANSMPILPPSP